MILLIRLFTLYVLCFLAISCSRFALLPDFKKIDNYEFKAASPLAERVAAPPAFLLEALKKMDKRQDYLSYLPTEADKLQITAALEHLPERQKAAMLSRLAGIFFVKNLSSGGYSDYIFDRNGTLHTILVLNPAILHTGMSQWIKDKELSAFLQERSDIVMDVDCAEEGRSALLYILLHESGHLLDYVAGCTPYVEKDLAKSGKPLSSVPFVSAAWQDYGEPLPAFEFPGRSRFHFYGNDNSVKRPRGEMPAAYQRLSETPFTLLYASQNWAEDFAETVAFAELKRITGKGCSIRIKEPGKPAFAFELLDRPAVKSRLPMLYSSCGETAEK